MRPRESYNQMYYLSTFAQDNRMLAIAVSLLLVDHAQRTSSRGANVLDFVNGDPSRWRSLLLVDHAQRTCSRGANVLDFVNAYSSCLLLLRR